jgi:hypothetical protein
MTGGDISPSTLTTCYRHHTLATCYRHHNRRRRGRNKQPYITVNETFTSVDQASSAQSVQITSTLQRYEVQPPADGTTQERPQNKLEWDMHILSSGDQKFRRERWDNGGAAQVRRTEYNHQTDQFNHSLAYHQDADDYAALLSDDDDYYCDVWDGLQVSPHQ